MCVCTCVSMCVCEMAFEDEDELEVGDVWKEEDIGWVWNYNFIL